MVAPPEAFFLPCPHNPTHNFNSIFVEMTCGKARRLAMLDLTIYLCLFLQQREIEVDLRTMLCADALATSRSTLGELTMYHTRASKVYIPSTCDGNGSEFGLTPRHLIDARSKREDFEVRL